MPARKHTPQEIIGKLRDVEILLGQDSTTAEAARGGAVRQDGRHNLAGRSGSPLAYEARAWNCSTSQARSLGSSTGDRTSSG
jgi:hypothetical protein